MGITKRKEKKVAAEVRVENDSNQNKWWLMGLKTVEENKKNKKKKTKNYDFVERKQ